MALREYDFENIPTVSIVKKVLTDAIKMEATDIHFDPTPDELMIKFRINGDLKEYTVAPDNVKTNILTRVKIIANMNITDSLLPQTGAISFEFNNKTHNMLVSSLPIVDGEKLVVHISNYAKNMKNLRSIGFGEQNYNKIKSLLKEPQGMILITGNTNSGKTTTTYSLLKELNSQINNIISIEDPVKMRIKGINQVQIAPEKGLTYKNVLKSVMLQDPNIIAINDLVDDDTARAALRASVSGRLVISTMHTKTAYQTIDTLLNMDIENYLLGSNLIGIISQRLVKKLCPACREKRHVTPYEASVIKHILGSEITELYYPNGCEECNDGYIDQIPIAEVIEIDEELRRSISNNRKRNLIRSIIYEENDSIIKDGFKKVLEGKTSFEEVLRVMDLRVDFINDTEIRNIILGNGEPTEAPTEETQPKKETTPVVEQKSSIEEQANQPEETNTVVETSESDNTTPIEEPKNNFVKVEVDTKEETNNITNLQVSETELKNILTQIEENATAKPEETQESSANEEEANIEPVQTEPEIAVTHVPPENTTDTESSKNSSITDDKEQANEQSPTVNIENTGNNENTANNDETQPTEQPIPVTVEEVKEEVQNKTEPEPETEPNPDEVTNTQVPLQTEVTPEIAKEPVQVNVEEQPMPTEEQATTNSTPENNEQSPVNPESTQPIEQQSTPVIEQNQEVQPTPIPAPIVATPASSSPINLEDEDDDDDNFNYGESYINNF